MDDETAEVIFTIQLQDLEEVMSKSKGKGRENDVLSDMDLALQLQQEELEQAAGLLNDRRMAQSIHRAVQDDGASIVILASEENTAAADRDIACRLGGQIPQTAPQRHNISADDETLSRFSAYNVNDGSDDDQELSMDICESNEAEGSAWAASRSMRQPGDQHQPCVSCHEVKEIIEVPCEHPYCRDCVRHLYTDAPVDETLFPPRCCRQPIPVSLVRHFLGSRITAKFERKAIEYGTLNRTYCSDASCATFIEPSHVLNSTGTCSRPGCERQTCTMCKRAAHAGSCPPGNPFEETIRLAQEFGWQRCQRCRTMVELGIGCNHIT